MSYSRPWFRRRGGYHRHYQTPRDRESRDPAVELTEEQKAEVDALFDIKYTYERQNAGTSWVLPTVGTMFTKPAWNDPTLQNQKKELNDVKEKLSDQNLPDWNSHTRASNLSGNCMFIVRRYKHPEMCTQAWCKFYEILATFECLVPKEGEFKTLHLCEAPGAFVCALNQFWKTSGDESGLPIKRNLDWTWLASTLNPWYEGTDLGIMIDDDRLLKDTVPNWHFGDDSIGDMMNKKTADSLIKAVDKVTLVTADGSVACQNNPAEQEGTIAPLHFAEVYVALKTLAVGGNFILKMFTLLESSSVNTCYLLNCVFKEVHIMKPVCSKGGNSEIYLVCLDFIGIEKKYLDKMATHFGPKPLKNAMFRKDQIPSTFLLQHIKLCKSIIDRQIASINRNLELHGNMTPEMRAVIGQQKYICGTKFMDKFKIQHLAFEEKVVHLPFVRKRRAEMDIQEPPKSRRRFMDGTFKERMEFLAIPWKERVWKMKTFNIQNITNTNWLQSMGPLEPERMTDWKPCLGKKYTKLMNSRFCTNTILEQFNEVWGNMNKSGIKFGVPQKDSQEVMNILRCHLDNWDEELNMIDISRKKQDILSQLKKDDPTNVKVHTIQEVEMNKDQGKRYTAFADLKPTEFDLVASEYAAKPELLSHIIKALKALKSGDMLVFRIHHCLSRFTAACVYILYRCFQKIALHQFLTDNILPKHMFLVGTGFRGVTPEILSYLTKVHSELHQHAKEENGDLLEFIPTKDILSVEEFRNYITQVNDYVLKQRINWLIRYEQSLAPAPPADYKPPPNPVAAAVAFDHDSIDICDCAVKHEHVKQRSATCLNRLMWIQ
ncbi:unnamed protein product [Owenia fusiformis]|uniref:Cap-specific mRNA (nucleoside-2'-O-)-methyltransferase 2 n=1 Tax=Owenia fusiformis TaxID=6347 RepID=A0A8S4NYF7_OWEFU|nr:unnamed protein product [Owenia fusiformis]